MRTALAVFVLLAAPAAAQEVEHGRWSFAGTESRGGVAWVTGLDDTKALWRLTVACADNGLSIDLAPPVPPKDGEAAVLTFNIGGAAYAAPATVQAPAEDPIWLAELSDDLSSGLAKGYSLRVFSPEGSVMLGLTDSARTITAAREACNVAREAAANALPPVDPAKAEAALRAHIAAACAPADPATGQGAILSRDLTSDGRVDHVIDWSHVSCKDPEGTQPRPRCDADTCDAEIFINPTLPPDPPTDLIRHTGLTLWPDRFIAIQSRSDSFDKPLNWRWDGTEFLASIPYNP